MQQAFLRPFPTDPLIIGGLLQLATGVQQLLGAEGKATEWNGGGLLQLGERPGTRTSRNVLPADTTASSQTGNPRNAGCAPVTTANNWVPISPSAASPTSSPTASSATFAPADWEAVAVDFSLQLYSAPGIPTAHRFIAPRGARAAPCVRLSLDEHRHTSRAHPPRLHQRRRSWSGAQASAAQSENEESEGQKRQRHKRSLSDGEQLAGQLRQHGQLHEGGAGFGTAPLQHPGPAARWLEVRQLESSVRARDQQRVMPPCLCLSGRNTMVRAFSGVVLAAKQASRMTPHQGPLPEATMLPAMLHPYGVAPTTTPRLPPTPPWLDTNALAQRSTPANPPHPASTPPPGCHSAGGRRLPKCVTV